MSDPGPSDADRLAPPSLHLHSESPSLCASGARETAAYELKFVLADGQARDLEQFARRCMFPDPHAHPARGDSYTITSLYLDTPRLDVFQRSPGYRRRKYRLRRYDEATAVFLERKSKRGDRVEKRRTCIAADEMRWLTETDEAGSWSGDWFRRRLAIRGLLPACRIAYERLALVGLAPEGRLRLTFDRRIRGVLTGEWDLDLVAGDASLFDGEVVCEFKYQCSLPALFKEMIETHRLSPRPVSKYRTFMTSVGRA